MVKLQRVLSLMSKSYIEGMCGICPYGETKMEQADRPERNLL